MRKTGRTRKAIYSVFAFDVHGNEDDGYYANDLIHLSSSKELLQEEVECYEGTPDAFTRWEVPDDELCRALMVGDITIHVEGEDGDILYVKKEADGYPLGELIFVGLKGKD